MMADCGRRGPKSRSVARSRRRARPAAPLRRPAHRRRRRLADRLSDHQPAAALVHVAKPRLEAGNRLAIGVKAEMSGFDDAGMHRTDGDLMQLGAFGGEKRVVCPGMVTGWRRALARPGGERMDDWPIAVVEPGPPVERADRDMAEEIEDRALEPDGARPHRAE